MGVVGRVPIRVAVVDDHPIARYGIEHMLTQADGVTLTKSVGSVADLDIEAGQVDVLVMDLYLEGEEPSLAALREIAERAHVLVMSASARPADVMGAIQAGAA